MEGDDRHNANEHEYSNGEITVFWKPSKCIHVTTCYRELIEVFNPAKRPWINMQGAPTDEIIRVVNLCPTQALSYKLNKDINPVKKDEGDKNAAIPPATPVQSADTEVKIVKDGPLIIKGNFKITGSSGNELSQMKLASFCRCGKSMKMPFCDGTHRNSGFKAD